MPDTEFRLTRAGDAERALLEQRSDDLAASILAPLTDAQRTDLAAAMRTIAVLGASERTA